MRTAAPGARRASGFTLLEAIVALVVFSLGAFTLTSWLSSNVIGLQRVQAQQQAELAVGSALAMLRTVNPMESPEGERAIGALTVRWRATPVQPPRDALTQIGQQTAFEVGLYLLDVEVAAAGGTTHQFQVRQLGYRQARAMEFE